MTGQTIFQLVLAVVLGGMVGLEREYRKKEAGLRTYSLVALGSVLFTIICCQGFKDFLGMPGVNFDPTRVVQAVATGIGFIGAGLIIYRGFHLEGLTTAAGLWIVAAVGVAVGVGLYWQAIFASILTLLILVVLRMLEEKLFGKDQLDKMR